MTSKNHSFSENPVEPTSPLANLPFWLPIVPAKKKKKCCKKYKKGKRCGKCPGR